MTPGSLRQLVFAFAEKPGRSKSDVVHQILDLWSRVPQRILLIIDEAHHMSGETLEDVRLLLTTLAQRGVPAVMPAIRSCARCCVLRCSRPWLSG
ncbi:MAG: ATP-binding protein [Candidatus Eremiobacterota bacterium]